MVDEYMEHYNCTRKQWDLKKMTPAQCEDTEKLTLSDNYSQQDDLGGINPNSSPKSAGNAVVNMLPSAYRE